MLFYTLKVPRVSSVVYVGVCLALALIILRGQSVSGYVVQANMWGVSRPLSQIRHRSELTERDWENAVQGLVKQNRYKYAQ